MGYLTRGKRSLQEHEYSVDVREWCRHFKVPVPRVQVRIRRGSAYRTGPMILSMAPDSSRDSLIHEFAHHLNHILSQQSGHGLTFRIALVQAATVAYGRAKSYNWGREYTAVKTWATKHGLTEGV